MPSARASRRRGARHAGAARATPSRRGSASPAWRRLGDGPAGDRLVSTMSSRARPRRPQTCSASPAVTTARPSSAPTMGGRGRSSSTRSAGPAISRCRRAPRPAAPPELLAGSGRTDRGARSRTRSAGRSRAPRSRRSRGGRSPTWTATGTWRRPCPSRPPRSARGWSRRNRIGLVSAPARVAAARAVPPRWRIGPPPGVVRLAAARGRALPPGRAASPRRQRGRAVRRPADRGADRGRVPSASGLTERPCEHQERPQIEERGRRR